MDYSKLSFERLRFEYEKKTNWINTLRGDLRDQKQEIENWKREHGRDWDENIKVMSETVQIYYQMIIDALKEQGEINKAIEALD